MRTYTIRRAVTLDAPRLAPRLRLADQQELAASGSCPLSSLMEGTRLSSFALTLDDPEGNPCLMAGVAPTGDPLVGCCWMLSEETVLKEITRTFIRQSQEWIRYFHTFHPVLTNEVWAGNTVHIRWLKWVGFTFTKSETRPNGEVFHTFMRLHHV